MMMMMMIPILLYPNQPSNAAASFRRPPQYWRSGLIRHCWEWNSRVNFSSFDRFDDNFLWKLKEALFEAKEKIWPWSDHL